MSGILSGKPGSRVGQRTLTYTTNEGLFKNDVGWDIKGVVEVLDATLQFDLTNVFSLILNRAPKKKLPIGSTSLATMDLNTKHKSLWLDSGPNSLIINDVHSVVVENGAVKAESVSDTTRTTFTIKADGSFEMKVETT